MATRTCRQNATCCRHAGTRGAVALRYPFGKCPSHSCAQKMGLRPCAKKIPELGPRTSGVRLVMQGRTHTHCGIRVPNECRCRHKLHPRRSNGGKESAIRPLVLDTLASGWKGRKGTAWLIERNRHPSHRQACELRHANADLWQSMLLSQLGAVTFSACGQDQRTSSGGSRTQGSSLDGKPVARGRAQRSG